MTVFAEFLEIHEDYFELLIPLDTFGNCQRAVFSLGVSQHQHNITNLGKFGPNCSSRLQESDYEKTPLLRCTI